MTDNYSMCSVTHKAIAYITFGTQLLVFSHPQHPEAGIQVPAGTVEDGESAHDAVLREAYEETGFLNSFGLGFLMMYLS